MFIGMLAGVLAFLAMSGGSLWALKSFMIQNAAIIK